MKKLILKLVLPLTIISFILYTKWWYVDLVLDDSNALLYGFPYPFMTNGPTSLSTVFFIEECIIDFLVYFLTWLVVIFFINRFIVKIIVKRIALIILWIIAIILMILTTMLWSMEDNMYFVKMPEFYQHKVIQTEFNFTCDDERRKYFTNGKE